MNWLLKIITNPFLVTGIFAWAVAQVLKTFVHWYIYKKLDILRVFGDGGMPSGHSATVTALAVFSALAFGGDSFEFAVTAILAIIVCHDAMGVRLETGKQAVVLNELVKAFNVLSSQELSEEVKLKEFVGHTPIQVITGIALGALTAFFTYFIIF